MISLRDQWTARLPRLLIVLHDLAMVLVAWVGLHWVRYLALNLPVPFRIWSPETAIVLVAQGAVFYKVGLYRGLWRFASVPDLWNILKACVAGVLIIAVGLFAYNRLLLVPRTVLVACLFWYLVWGTAGLFLAMPLMAAIRAVCANVPGWAPWGELMSSEHTMSRPCRSIPDSCGPRPSWQRVCST